MAAVTPEDFSDGNASPGGIPLPEELSSMRDRLIGRLEALRVRLRWQIGLEGAARILAALLGLVLLGCLLDKWLELSFGVRMLYWLVVGVLLGVLAWRHLYSPLQGPWGPIDLAAALDRVGRAQARYALAPRVATVLQLPTITNLAWAPSKAMIEQAVRRSFSRLDATDFLEHINRRHLTYCLAALAGTVLFPTILAAAFPSTARLWANRWLLGSNAPWPRYTSIAVVGEKDGRLIVPRGESSILRVQVADERSPTQMVWMKQEDSAGNAETVVLENYGGGEFRREMPPLDQPVSIQLWGGDARTEPIVLDPLDRPRINELKLVYRSPRDTTSRTHDFRGEDGNLALFADSDVELTLVANVPIDKVEVMTESSELGSFERVDENTFKTAWKHKDAVRMRVSLTATDSGLVSHPRPIAVGLRRDQPPTVSLSHSGVGSRITPVATIPLKVLARDDLGLKEVDLHLERDKQDSTQTSPPPANADAAESKSSETGKTPREDHPSEVSLFVAASTGAQLSVEQSHDWDLEPLGLQPGGVVRFFAQATDDCHLGTQTSRSRTIAFHVVPAEELFREILVRQQQLRARLRKSAEEAESIRDQLKIAELPQQAEEFLRRHRLVQREVWQVQKALDNSATEMKLNRLGGPETHELMVKQIIEPLGRIHDGLLSTQRDAMERLGRPGAEPFEQTLDRQEQILTSLQRILANMRQWDSFVDVVNQLNSVIKQEREIREKTEELRKSQFESIFDK